MTTRRTITLAALGAAAVAAAVGAYVLRCRLAAAPSEPAGTDPAAWHRAAAGPASAPLVRDRLLADLLEFELNASTPAGVANIGIIKGGAGKTAIPRILADLYSNGTIPIGIDRATGEPVGFNPLSDRSWPAAETDPRRDGHGEDVLDVEFDEAPARALSAAPHAKQTPPPDRPEYRTAAAGLPRAIIVPVWLNLEQMLDRDIVAFVELVYLARDPEHELFGGASTAEIFERYGFYDKVLGIQTTCKQVILAATAGTGADLELRSVHEVLADS